MSGAQAGIALYFRAIALAAAVTSLAAGPAAANSGSGWYFDLAGGWDHSGTVTATDHYSVVVPPPRFGGKSTAVAGTAIVPIGMASREVGSGALGYKFESHIRLEAEIGMAYHPVAQQGYNGHVAPGIGFLNVAYDLPLFDNCGISAGGGAGYGFGLLDIFHAATEFTGSPYGFAYQGFVGLFYSLGNDVDLTVEGRYRALILNTHEPAFALSSMKEEAVMVGFRWFPFAAHDTPPPNVARLPAVP